jgi:GTP-binding protein
MNINLNKAEFVRSAVKAKDFPRDNLPQIAFAGRSNVGKSSVINRLLNRKNFARVGAAPGKTTHINYFLIDGQFYLVDLPGYGFATASVEVKEKWGRMIEHYLRTSKALKRVFLLVDIRHAPSANDRMMYEWIVQSGMESVVIATKKDKLKPSQIDKSLKQIRTGLNLAAGTRVIPFSSETREGRDAVWDLIREASGSSDSSDSSDMKGH